MTELADDAALTLKDACTIFFRDAIKPASLRAEARRGNLSIARIGRMDFVTPAAIREMMVKKCPSDGNRPGSTSPQKNASGSSETDRARNALAAAKATASELKKLSRGTSKPAFNQPSAKILPLASRSPKS